MNSLFEIKIVYLRILILRNIFIDAIKYIFIKYTFSYIMKRKGTIFIFLYLL